MNPDRAFYVGKTLDKLEDAKLGLETTLNHLWAEIIAHRKRGDDGRVAEHHHMRAAIDSAIEECIEAIAMIDDVIQSGHSADSAEEQEDAARLASVTRERQI